MKDPAFLFYSKDFYEGTRMMLPEERACYIDLLIYQHQNGNIPLDLKRVLLYCSNIDKATLEATLEAKFVKTENGWYNERLKNEILNRETYKNSQSDNGKIGQFWKKAKQILKAKEFSILHNELKNKEFILKFIDNNEINISTLKGLLKQCLSNKGSVNGDENEIEDLDENGKPKFNFKKSMYKLGFDKILVDEFMKIRKDKRATNSELALQNLISEIEKTGKPRNEVLEIIVKKQWKGFEAKWLKEEQSPPNSAPPPRTDAMAKNMKLAQEMGMFEGKTTYEPYNDKQI